MKHCSRSVFSEGNFFIFPEFIKLTNFRNNSIEKQRAPVLRLPSINKLILHPT